MSENNNSTTVNAGIGFFGLLTIVFIVLKLTGVIGWSWWLVILPFFVPLVIFLVFIICIIVAGWFLLRDV
jgi:hypothetical protein